MGKRKVREEEITPTTNHYLPAPQILKSRELVDVKVIIHLNDSAKLNKRKRKPNPYNPTNKWRLINDVSEGFDQSPEATRMKEYAISALTTGPTEEEDYELVQIGPLAVGELSRTHHILHLNFKAKNLSAPGEDDAVETYFCELTETIDSGHISVLNCISLGPSYLLPEKADTRGCLYCSSCNIHHSHRMYSFQNGGKQYAETLISKLRRMDTYLRKHKTETAFTKMFPDPGLEYADEYKTTQVPLDRFATVALRIYNGKQGSNFELVKIGKCGFTCGSFGLVYHLNFKAKSKDDLGAGAQTFFAQAIERGCYFLVDFCSCLGPTKSLPDKADADLRGCCYCKAKRGVHHPPGPGYLTGREIDHVMERFGNCNGRV